MRIAFGHKSRVGKDIACSYLQQCYGGETHRFSDKIYKIMYYAQHECGFMMHKDPEFLQWVGTDWGRKRNPYVWINSLLKQLSPIETDNMYVADLRFYNELTALKENGFICVKIERENREIDRDITHTSETALENYDEWDYVIKNNSSVDDFYAELDKMVEKFYVFEK